MSENLPIPPTGTRGADNPVMALLMRAFRPLMARQVAGYRKATSPEPKLMMGFPTVLLTTVGARTGAERTQILGGFADGSDAWLVMASLGGSAKHPAWYINLAKHPDQVWLEVGNRKLRVKPELLEGERRSEALERIAAVAPRYRDYESKTDRRIPILRLTPAA
ncbi:MAG TPA: nitroreductase/quinone reductase family protein [Candidatus Dormibacteraeota bacterium]|nr:nitroreductase/quinone reductase family protein [Candidatus Dormibacteraeota bacterium]